jgi:hypothetical protein
MSDLRLVGVSNGFLDLVADDGTKHRLVIDAALESAARSRSDSALRGNLSPREIQAQIRAGLTVAEVAAATGETVEAIDKYAAPIVAELEHVISMAKAVRLTFAAERFSDAVQVAFGNVMQERIELAGGRDFAWRAKRNSSSDFEVSIEYELAGKRLVASWSFDPKRIFLSPQNEAAIQLSNGAPLTSNEPAKLRPVAEVITLQAKPEAKTEAKPEAKAEAKPASQHPAERSAEPESKPALKAVPDLDESSASADVDFVDEIAFVENQDHVEDEVIHETTGIHLVVESASEPGQKAELIDIIETEQTIEEPVIEEVTVEEQAPAKEKPKTTRGSWDEVLFGSKIDPNTD